MTGRPGGQSGQDGPDGDDSAAPAPPEPRDALRARLRPARELPRGPGARQRVEVEGIDESLRPVIDAAVADLRARLGPGGPGGAAAVTVVAAGSVTWSDGSCGCPEPGRAYLQVLVDGAYVRLTAGDQVFHYHAGRGRAPFPCPG